MEQTSQEGQRTGTQTRTRAAIQMTWFKNILHSVLRLGIGELIARLSSFALTAYISRKFGLNLLGALALAQTVAMYVIQGTDQGFRLIGARIVARDPGLASATVPLVTKKRATTGVVCVVAGLAYAAFGPMPSYSRLCVAGFVIAVLPYALSLDWLAWGMSYFGWLGSWRAGVGLTLMAGAFLGFALIPDPRWVLVGANLASAVAGALVLWFLWRFSWKKRLPGMLPANRNVAAELRWTAALPLGLAVILSQMFHNADTLILGAMAPLSEVGRYSAAYKILFLICGGYYLITQSMYPWLSAVSGGARARSLMLLGIGFAALMGTLIAAVLWFFAQPILVIIYGSDLGATHLLRILVFAIPMDFVVALLQVVMVSRGFDRFGLLCNGIATFGNIGLNLILIPKLGAEGAAVATIVSYVLLDLTLLVGFMVKPVFKE